MDVFVIGGTGLISTGIVQQLHAAGHAVTVFTRGTRGIIDSVGSEGARSSRPEDDRTSLPDGVTHVQGDRHDTVRLESVVAEADPDALIDMVCFSPETARESVDAVADAIDQYVFCSTVDVYHRPPDTNPITEDARRHPNVSEYGRNKAAAEDVFMDAHEAGRIETTIIRPWSTYGEGGRVLHTFGDDTYYVSRLRAGKPIVVHGDGTSIWGPCHRDDVARAFVNALGNDAAFGEAYHVTSEEFITWNQYHRRVARVIDAPEPELVHVPTDVLSRVAPKRTEMLRDHFQYATTFDNSKAERDLDYEYTIDFETGISRTVAWLDDHDQIESWESEPFDDTLIDTWRDATDEVVDSLAEHR